MSGAVRPRPAARNRWIDTLPLAQKRFPGMHNSLDALCKRFKISLADRKSHGALIDAHLLAEVYLELRGGKERVLDLTAGAEPQRPHRAWRRNRPDRGHCPCNLAQPTKSARVTWPFWPRR